MAQQPGGGSAKSKALQSMAKSRVGLESDIRMFEQYKKEAAMRPQGEPFYTFPEWKEMRQQMPDLPKLAKGGNDFGMDSMAPKARSRTSFNDQPKGNQIMKEAGGNWLTGSVEQKLKPLKPYASPSAEDKAWIASHRADWDSRPESDEKTRALRAIDNDMAVNTRNEALNNWVDRNLTNYVKKQMATKEDPVRGLFEQGVTHIPHRDVGLNRFRAPQNRAAQNQPQLAQTDEGKAWENATDAITGINTISGLHKSFHEPWMDKVSPDTKVAHVTDLGNLGFDHIMDVLREDLAEGRIRPEQLNKISMEQAVRRAHEYNEEKKKKMAETAIKNTEGMPLVKQYDDGHKWIELAKPKDLPNLPEGHELVQAPNKNWAVKDKSGNFIDTDDGMYFGTAEEATANANELRAHGMLKDALKYEGDTMGHCVGGYTPDVLAGKSRIFSLRDAKGEPHVTIETEPHGAHNQDVIFKKLIDKLGRDPTMEEFQSAVAEVPPRIIQIKGKGNGKPVAKYIPMVQDFVKSGKWSDVGDLQNTDLLKVGDQYGTKEEHEANFKPRIKNALTFLKSLPSETRLYPQSQHRIPETIDSIENAKNYAVDDKDRFHTLHRLLTGVEMGIAHHGYTPPKATGGIIRMATGGSTGDIDEMKLALMNKDKFMKGSKAKERLYHGTGNLEALHSFDPAMTGKGLDQLGSGFYFATDPKEASSYAMHAHNAPSRQGEGKIGGSSSPGVVAAHVNIKKPIRVGKNGTSLNDAKVNLTHDQVKQIMGHAPNINHPEESPLGNHVDTSRGVTPKMIHDIAKLYTGNNLYALENDIFPNEPTAYRNALHQVTGHDGVIKDFGNGRKHYVAWFPHQIKSAIGNKGGYDPANPDITMAKGGKISSETKAEFISASKVPDVLYRGGVGHKELPEDFLKGKARPGYATFASTSPHVAGSYAHSHEDGDEMAGGIAPMHIKVHTLHEFPVTVDRRGLRKFNKFAFDQHAKQLQPGHALVARQVYDQGPRASLKTDPDRLYSHPSDIYAWNNGTEVKSALEKAKGGTVKDYITITERPL